VVQRPEDGLAAAFAVPDELETVHLGRGATQTDVVQKVAVAVRPRCWAETRQNRITRCDCYLFSLIRGLTESKKGAYLSWANGADFTQNAVAAVWVQCTTVLMITFSFPRGGYRRLAETTFLAECPISNYTV